MKVKKVSFILGDVTAEKLSEVERSLTNFSGISGLGLLVEKNCEPETASENQTSILPLTFDATFTIAFRSDASYDAIVRDLGNALMNMR